MSCTKMSVNISKTRHLLYIDIFIWHTYVNIPTITDLAKDLHLHLKKTV